MNQQKLHDIIAKHTTFPPTLDGFIDFTDYLQTTGSDFLSDGMEDTATDYDTMASVLKELHTTLE